MYCYLKIGLGVFNMDFKNWRIPVAIAAFIAF